MSTLQYAMMSYALSRQAHDPEKADIAQMCKAAERLNLKAMNMVGLYKQKASDVRQITDQHGISIICYTFGFDFQNVSGGSPIDNFQKELDVAQTLGAPMVLVLLNGSEQMSRLQNRDMAIERLQEIVPLATARGIMVTVENFPNLNGPFLDSTDLRSAVLAVPGLKLTFDNGNCLIAGEDPCQAFLSNKKDFVHAHFKDWVNAPSDTQLYTTEGLDGCKYIGGAIGTGPFDYTKLLQVMKEADFDGYIEIEYLGEEYPAEEGVRRAIGFLTKIEESL